MSDRRLPVALALCALSLAACGGGGGDSLLGADSSPSPLTSSAAPTAGTPTSAAPRATARPHPAAHATTTAPTHAPTSAPPAPATSHPTAVKTSAKPKPTSTGPVACAHNTSSTSLAMVNSGAEYAFSPTSVTVTCGGVVHVTNNSTYDHTMSPNGGGFTDSGDVAPTMSADVRFSYRGTYGFYCSIHTYMTGTVKVT